MHGLDARRELATFLNARPDATIALFAAAEAWYRLGKFDKARLNYTSLMAAYPDSGYNVNCRLRLPLVEAGKAYAPPANDDLKLYRPPVLPR